MLEGAQSSLYAREFQVLYSVTGQSFLFKAEAFNMIENIIKKNKKF